MLSQHQNVEGQTRPPNHVLEKRSIDTELSESYFYAREFSEAIGTELSQLLYEFYLTNALKVAIYKSSESGDDADKSEAFFGEVSIYVKDYVNTDALTDGILSKYDDNPIFSIWDGTANEEKLFSAQLIRLEKTESTGEYVSPVTGKSIVPIYEEDASTYNTNGEVKNFYAKCRGPAPIIITPFIHCPHVRIDPSSFSLRSNGTGIIIEELNLYIDNAMFRRVNNSYVLICLDTFLDAVNQTLNKERYQSKAVSSEIEGIVSFTMSCLSVLCLVLTLLTFMLFPVLRTQPGLNNMFLSVFFIVAYIALVFGSTQTIGSIGCVILGGIIHFCWILVFFWMNVCSIHMFRVFSSLGRQMPSQINVCLTLKYLLYSVGSTTAIMGINIAASFYISNGDSYGYGQMYNGLCYIHYPLMVLVTMALPANIIVISNIIMFLIISMKIRNSSKIQKHTQNERNYFMIYVRLSTITGITWLSSIPMLLTGSPVFAYIFVVLNCCQGIFIFIAFICNRRVVNLYRKMIASAGSAITSNSDTNENTFTLPSSQCSSISIGNRNESTEEFGSNLNMRTINNTSEMLNNATHTRGSMGTRDTTEVFNTKL